MSTNLLSVREIVTEAWRGKTLARILTNAALRPILKETSGKILDLAGGGDPRYVHFLTERTALVRTNRIADGHVAAVDFNAPLPFPENSFDVVLLINALYIVENPTALASEVLRILKPGGRWIVASPLIANEMPEPHDYMRLTAEGLTRMGNVAGFQTRITRVGERVSAAAYLLHPFFLLNSVRAFIFPLAYLLDRAIPQRVRKEHPTPLLYIVECIKPV